MYAFLLCAGFGTRMRPLTNETPKSLVEVAGRSFLGYLLDELAAWSALTDIHVAVNHQDAPAFHRWAAALPSDLTADGLELHLHDDGVEAPDDQLGSVGDLKLLLDEVGIPPDGALVSGGDSVYRFPLAPILNAYQGTTNDVLALYEPDPERRAQSSVLRLDGATVAGVLDDPTRAASTRICPSWLLLSAEGLRAVSAYLDDGGAPDTLGPFLDRLARTHSVRAHRLPATADLRLHCNTLGDLERARRLLRAAPWHILSPDTVRDSLAEAEA